MVDVEALLAYLIALTPQEVEKMKLGDKAISFSPESWGLQVVQKDVLYESGRSKKAHPTLVCFGYKGKKWSYARLYNRKTLQDDYKAEPTTLYRFDEYVVKLAKGFVTTDVLKSRTKKKIDKMSREQLLELGCT